MICIEHYIGVNLIKPLPVCFHHTCLFHTNISVMKAAIILTVFFIFLLVKKVLKENQLDLTLKYWMHLSKEEMQLIFGTWKFRWIFGSFPPMLKIFWLIYSRPMFYICKNFVFRGQKWFVADSHLGLNQTHIYKKSLT